MQSSPIITNHYLLLYFPLLLYVPLIAESKLSLLQASFHHSISYHFSSVPSNPNSSQLVSKLWPGTMTTRSQSIAELDQNIDDNYVESDARMTQFQADSHARVAQVQESLENQIDSRMEELRNLILT